MGLPRLAEEMSLGIECDHFCTWGQMLAQATP